MPGLPPDAVRASLFPAARYLLSPKVGWPESRKRFDLATKLPPPPGGTKITPATLGGVPGLEITPKGVDASKLLIYFHGGGYCVGSATSHKAFVARVAAAAGVRAFSADYRMGDEHPYPAAVDDALAIYQAVLDDGTLASSVVVAGDSAGGGLSVALAYAARDAKLPLPAALGLICPWLDLRREANAARPDARREPLLSRSRLQRFADSYLGGQDASDPKVSPLLGDLKGLPPLVVHWAGDDLLAPDGRAVAEQARAAGVEVEERGFPGLWHDFHLIGPLLAGEGSEALGAMGAGLGRHLR